MFARQALTLDHVSNGRLEIGLGTGLVGDPSNAMIGVADWDAEGTRRTPVGEYLEIVDRLLRDEVTIVRTANATGSTAATTNPRPVQSPRPPITVGAIGPADASPRGRTGGRRGAPCRSRPSFDDQVAEIRQRRRDWTRSALRSDGIPLPLASVVPPVRCPGAAARRHLRLLHARSTGSRTWRAASRPRHGRARALLPARREPDRPSSSVIATDVLPRLAHRAAAP